MTLNTLSSAELLLYCTAFRAQLFDLDILIEATSENVQRLLAAMEMAGFGSATMTNANDVLANEITVFNDRVRIDVQTSTPGISFKDAWNNRKTITYNGQDFFVLSREDLIRTKRACGRDVDMEDVRLLELPDNDKDTD